MKFKLEQKQISHLLESYIFNLKQLELQIQSERNPRLKVLLLRVKLTIQSFTAKANDLVTSSTTALQKLKKHFADTFDCLHKDMCRLLHHNTHTNQISRFKLFEKELNQNWENDSKFEKQNTIPPEFKKIGKVIMLQNNLQKTKLIQLAKNYLQKQFFAFRLLSYQMYEQYTAHQHPMIQQRIADAQEEVQRLSIIIKEIKQVNQTLTKQQRRLRQELNELKQVNQVLIRRAFPAQEQQK